MLQGTILALVAPRVGLGLDIQFYRVERMTTFTSAIGLKTRAARGTRLKRMPKSMVMTRGAKFAPIAWTSPRSENGSIPRKRAETSGLVDTIVPTRHKAGLKRGFLRISKRSLIAENVLFGRRWVGRLISIRAMCFRRTIALVQARRRHLGCHPILREGSRNSLTRGAIGGNARPGLPRIAECFESGGINYDVDQSRWTLIDCDRNFDLLLRSVLCAGPGHFLIVIRDP